MAEIDNIEMWRLRKFIEHLQAARGNGTSMISLLIPPTEKLALVTRRLAEEEGTATNIKSRVNRLSVIAAIRSTLGKLKLYSKVPENGLCIFSGSVITDEGKERKILWDYIPPKPLGSYLYLCDSRFHTDPLEALLSDPSVYGFIIINGHSCLFGTLTGPARHILLKFTVDLPKKHGRGGQSAVRFGRLREEKRHNYVRKVCENATKLFIGGSQSSSNTGADTSAIPNVKGLIIGGAGGFKDTLASSDMLDQRLKRIVVKTVDLSYGGEEGFVQAIKLSEDVLKNVRFVEEAKIIRGFLDEIGKGTNKVCYGVDDTLRCLDMSAVDTIIMHEELRIWRLKLRPIAPHDDTAPSVASTAPSSEGETTKESSSVPAVVRFVHPHELKEPTGTPSQATLKAIVGPDFDILKCELMIEWMVRNYKKKGCSLELITDKSEEGAQFCAGFGGIGGMLRWPVDVVGLRMLDEEDESDSDLDEISDFI